MALEYKSPTSGGRAEKIVLGAQINGSREETPHPKPSWYYRTLRGADVTGLALEWWARAIFAKLQRLTHL